jgi:hypothetical protein
MIGFIGTSLQLHSIKTPGLLYIPCIMRRQLIGHNSLHNTLVAYV